MNIVKSFIERMRMPLPELEAYYREKRQTDFRMNRPMRGKICFRKRTRRLILAMLRLNRLFLGLCLKRMGQSPVEDDRPRIYACTHNYRYDFEMCFEAIRKSCWLFMGDPNETYKNLDGFLLWLNGVILMDTIDREDCHVGKETAIRLLVQGGSLLIYPEGAWNLSENLPVQPLYTGAAEMAMRTGVEIVPLALEQYGKQFYINMGEELNPSGFADKRQLTEALRDAMATLRWEIWERRGIEKRSSLPDNASAAFRDRIMSETENGYTVEEIERTRYHSLEESKQRSAFAHLSRLIPCRENAFLFDKRLLGLPF